MNSVPTTPSPFLSEAVVARLDCAFQILVFLILPFLLVCFWAGNLWDSLERKEYRENAKRLDVICGNLNWNMRFAGDVAKAGDWLRRVRPALKRIGMNAGIYQIRSHGGESIVAQAIGEFLARGKSHITIDGTLFVVRPLREGILFWVSRSIRHIPTFQGWRLFLSLAGSIFIGYLILLRWRIHLGMKIWSVSLRRKLVFWFLFAAGIPMSAILFSGNEYLEQKKASLIQAADEEAHHLLRRFDESLDPRKTAQDGYLEKRASILRRTLPRSFLFGYVRTGQRLHLRRLAHKQLRMNVPHARLLRAMHVEERDKSLVLGEETNGFLLTGMKGTKLNGYVIAACPLHYILEPLRKTRVNLWLFLGVNALVALMLGFMLSDDILVPLSQLGEGVHAIRRHDFRFRLTPQSKDELGMLAETFNTAFESLGDLQIGRILQENFFPAPEFISGEYHLYGRTIPATQLSGDYLDFQLTSDSKIAVIAGDASGHGAGAGLVMAMAKAIFFRGLDKNKTPEEIMQNLNRVINKTMKRRRLMTCVLAIIDQRTHQVKIINAGHVSPLLLRKDKIPRRLETRSHMLGIRPEIRLAPFTISMEPGDMLFFYSDCLAEAHTSFGTQIEFRNIEKRSLHLNRLTPPKAWESMYEWFTAQTTPLPQEDDLSMLFCARNEKK